MRHLKLWTASSIPRATRPIIDKSRIWSSGAGAQGLEELVPDDQYWRRDIKELYEIFSVLRYVALSGHVSWTLMRGIPDRSVRWVTDENSEETTNRA
jgi:hypothetical protein